MTALAVSRLAGDVGVQQAAGDFIDRGLCSTKQMQGAANLLRGIARQATGPDCEGCEACKDADGQ